jgi:hypothetical protein
MGGEKKKWFSTNDESGRAGTNDVTERPWLLVNIEV